MRMDENTLIKQTSTKLFIGFLVTSELRMHLNNSQAWKNAQVTPDHANHELFEVHYAEQDYIGCYLTQEKLTLTTLAELEKQMTEKLTVYCPKLDYSRFKCYIFSQFFIH